MDETVCEYSKLLKQNHKNEADLEVNVVFVDLKLYLSFIGTKVRIKYAICEKNKGQILYFFLL